MDRTFQLYPFFFFAQPSSRGCFSYASTWPVGPTVCLGRVTLLVFILLLRKARDYRERILQEAQRIPRNHPHPELIARKKTILIFAVAMLSSWMGYGMAAIGLSVHNPLIRTAFRNEATLFLLAPRSREPAEILFTARRYQSVVDLPSRIARSVGHRAVLRRLPMRNHRLENRRLEEYPPPNQPRRRAAPPWPPAS